ncbi:MAG: hypothetical protein JF606_27140 [Burkholderiales bacterium]|nr:hypothetical protein [Burkholderiales bacterium]
MNTALHARTDLTLNRRFVRNLLDAKSPSCALGLIEAQGELYGLVALSPKELVPPTISAKGFELGHRVLGGDGFEVVQLTFEFRGFETYHVLLNPSSPVVRSVLERMIDSDDFFILVLGPGGAEVFRSDVGQETLFWLQAFLPRLLASRTSAEQYAKSLAVFCRHPSPPGRVLDWVCGDDMRLLDLSADRVELKHR